MVIGKGGGMEIYVRIIDIDKAASEVTFSSLLFP